MNVLQRPVLVLNKSYQPVHVARVARALTLLWKGAARVLDVDYQTFAWDDWSRLQPAADALALRSYSFQFRVPEIIVLTSFNKVRSGPVTFSRNNLYKRDHFLCQYCGCKLTREESTLDHVLPKSRGGTSIWENSVLACLPCNKKKDNRTPEEAGMKLRKQPVRPDWQPRYANPNIRLKSWEQFVSAAYWNVPLQQ